MKTKIEICNLIKYLVIFITAALLIWMAVTLSFLYKNFYLTIQEADSINQLQREISAENVNIELFNEVDQKIKQKENKKTPDFGAVENPFI
ncbi:MAG: hypothetical protein U9O66_02870 [Patescibacteria group bacterium]|nr:hypothetical protein [Patescibacteria group bacterium]